LFEEAGEDESFAANDNQSQSVVLGKSHQRSAADVSQGRMSRHFSADDDPSSLRGNGSVITAPVVSLLGLFCLSLCCKQAL